MLLLAGSHQQPCWAFHCCKSITIAYQDVEPVHASFQLNNFSKKRHNIDVVDAFENLHFKHDPCTKSQSEGIGSQTILAGDAYD